MPVASSQYWNSVPGREAGEAAQDEEGLQTMRTLARNMTFLMKSIALGKERYGLPEKGISENELYPVNRFCGNDTLCLSESSGSAGFCLQALCQAQERNAVLWRRLKLSHMRNNIGIRYAESMIRHEEWN